LVVTSHFIKPVETRINNEYEVRRKEDGTSFTREELLTAADGADAILITPSTGSMQISSDGSHPPSR
jgi:acyl-CoA thioesterase